MREKYRTKLFSPTTRLLIAGCLSIILLVSDTHFKLFKEIKFYIESFLSPVYFIADAPVSIIRNVSERMYSYQELLEERDFLKRQIQEIRTDLLLYDGLIRDNDQLRKLNNSPITEYTRKIGAEVLMVDTNPFSLTVMINRGAKDGVYEGQPVINEEGIVGQVISLAKNTSRVLLITDQNHSIPVVVMRNGIRAIATGTGLINELSIVNMPRNVDIKVGDLLVTSGLGGKFPKGYPVARVTAFDRKDGLQFAEIKAQPLAALDRLRFMLLIWLPKGYQENINEIISNFFNYRNELEKR
ncbi:MAG: rod shape-determining protein MreC [Succinivibrionaceae bacterium]